MSRRHQTLAHPYVQRATDVLVLIGIGMSVLAPGVPLLSVLAFALPWTLRLLWRPRGEALVAGQDLRATGGVLVALLIGWMLHRLGSAPAGHALGALLTVLTWALGFVVLIRQTAFSVFVRLLLSTTQALGSAFLFPGNGMIAAGLAYVLALGWTLLLFERDLPARASESAEVGTRHLRAAGAERLVLRPLLRASLVLLVLAVPLGLLLYVAAPRSLQALAGLREFDGMEGRPRLVNAEVEAGAGDAEGGSPAQAGPNFKASDDAVTVEFGAVAAIKQNFTPFLEVRVEGDPGIPRGVILRDSTLETVHPNGNWEAPRAHGRGARAYYSGGDGRLRLGAPDAGAFERTLLIDVLAGIRSRLYLEPEVLWLEIERRGRPHKHFSIRARGDDMMKASVAFAPGDRIRQGSRPVPLDHPGYAGRRSDARVSPLPSYLQLPPGHAEPLRRMALGVVGVETDPWRRAQLLTLWLKSESFTYTLRLPKLRAEQRVLDFLNRTRSGHCACYATSLAVLLRSLGHPARYARGFWGGDPSSKERGSVVFRGTHYHAWTELFLDGVGWVPLNPTPPDRRAIDADTESVEGKRRADDEQGGGLDLSALLSLDREAWGELWSDIGRQVGSLFQPGAWFVGFPLVLLLLLALRRLRGWVFGRGRPNAPAMAGTPKPKGPYALALKRLARAGIRRPASSTPREFLLVVEARCPEARDAMAWFTRAHEATRYGGARGRSTEAAGQLGRLQRGLRAYADRKGRARKR